MAQAQVVPLRTEQPDGERLTEEMRLAWEASRQPGQRWVELIAEISSLREQLVEVNKVNQALRDRMATLQDLALSIARVAHRE